MTKIYVVANEEYSDYHIEGVFSSREKANAARAAKIVFGVVETHNLDPEVDRLIEKGWRLWWVTIEQGVIKYCKESGKRYSYQELIAYGRRNSVTFYPAAACNETQKQPFARLFLWANSRERAVKTASELYSQAAADPRNRWYEKGEGQGKFIMIFPFQEE
jgi:hypothetical protein